MADVESVATAGPSPTLAISAANASSSPSGSPPPLPEGTDAAQPTSVSLAPTLPVVALAGVSAASPPIAAALSGGDKIVEISKRDLESLMLAASAAATASIRSSYCLNSLPSSLLGDRYDIQEAVSAAKPLLAVSVVAEEERPLAAPRCGYRLVLQLVVIALVVAVGGAVLHHYLHVSAPGVVHRLASDIKLPSVCQPLAPEDIRNNTAFGGRTVISELRDSLLTHMYRLDVSMMCAPHVGLPLCYCVMYSSPGAKPRPGQRPANSAYFELFNPQVVSIQSKDVRFFNETIHDCSTRHVIAERAYTVSVQFLDYKAVLEEARWSGARSALFQYGMEVLYDWPSRCGRESVVPYMKKMLDASAEVPQNYAPQLTAS